MKSLFLFVSLALFSLALSVACSRMELEPSSSEEGGVAAEPEEPAEIISITVGNPWGDDAADAGDNAGEGTGTEPAGGENAGEGQGEPAAPGEPGESGDPEAPQESGEPQEPGGPEESDELEEGTKISYTYADSKLKQAWQVGDKLLIYGRTKGDYKIFTCDAVYSNGRGHFNGTKPNAANTRFDIVVLGKKSNVSFTNVRDMLNVCFNEMTQTGNNNLNHIESYVWLENVNTYWDIQFNSSWASSHGSGTFNMNPMIHFRIKVPSGRTPKKIGLVSTAARLIPHYKGGRKVNSIWLYLNSVTPSSNIFEAWMPLPEALGAGNYAVSVLLDNNYYYLTKDFYSGGFASGQMYKVQRDLTIAANVTSYNAHANVTSGTYPLRTDGSFTDWDNRILYAHPLLETRTLPANYKYADLYEVRMIADQGWVFGCIEFKMLGWSYSMPLDVGLCCGHTGGTWKLDNALYGDGQKAFSDANVDRYLEHTGLTETSAFNNWRADNSSDWDNKLQWYNFTGSAGAGIFDTGNLTRQYYTAAVPQQLTKYYIGANGTFNSGSQLGRLEFRLRRFTLNATGTTIKYGIKLMGKGGADYTVTGWHCRGLLPQGGTNASGVRTVLPMAQMTVPTYSDYEYPFVDYE
ncbi:MAG: hypothetical protein K5651_08840 [Bacteroidales bacterium]|nr:hypothetical protein [Bacteroidales bacterium]